MSGNDGKNSTIWHLKNGHKEYKNEGKYELYYSQTCHLRKFKYGKWKNVGLIYLYSTQNLRCMTETLSYHQEKPEPSRLVHVRQYDGVIQNT